MNGMVYSVMVKSGVAIQLDHEIWLDSKGEITDNKDEAVSKKTKYPLTHPKLVSFVNEVGD